MSTLDRLKRMYVDQRLSLPGLNDDGHCALDVRGPLLRAGVQLRAKGEGMRLAIPRIVRSRGRNANDE